MAADEEQVNSNRPFSPFNLGMRMDKVWKLTMGIPTHRGGDYADVEALFEGKMPIMNDTLTGFVMDMIKNIFIITALIFQFYLFVSSAEAAHNANNLPDPHSKWEGHTGAIKLVSFSPDGKWLASARVDKQIIIHNASSGEKQTCFGYPDELIAISWNAEGKLLAIATKTQVVIYNALKSSFAIS